MELSQEDDLVEKNAQKGRSPWLVVIAVFRFLAAGLAFVPFALIYSETKSGTHTYSSSGPIFLFSIMLAAILGLPSILIAIGLLRRARWAAWLAVLIDAFVIALVAGVQLSGVIFPRYQSSSDDVMFWSAVIALVWLPFLLEGGYLTGWLSRRRFAGTAFCVLSAAVLAAGLMGPSLSARAGRERIEPIVSYAGSHWIEIPGDARISASEVDMPVRIPGTQKNGQARVWRFDRVTSVHVETSEAVWDIRARLRGIDAWRFRGGRKLEESHIALTGRPLKVSLPVKSAEDARKVLANAGVIDPQLKPAGENERNGQSYYCFLSKKADGSYAVDQKSGAIVLYLRGDVNLR